MTIELRDDGGLVLGRVACDTSSLGWHTGVGEQEVRFQLERLPLADGRFHLRVALTDPASGELLHTLEDGIRFFVFPAGAATGAVLLDGDWSLQETAADAPIGRP